MFSFLSLPSVGNLRARPRVRHTVDGSAWLGEGRGAPARGRVLWKSATPHSSCVTMQRRLSSGTRGLRVHRTTQRRLAKVIPRRRSHAHTKFAVHQTPPSSATVHSGIPDGQRPSIQRERSHCLLACWRCYFLKPAQQIGGLSRVSRESEVQLHHRAARSCAVII